MTGKGGGGADGFVLLDELALCVRATGLARERIKELADFAREQGRTLVDVIVDLGGAEEATFLKSLADELDLPFVEEVSEPVAPEIVSQVSPRLAIRYLAMPLGEAAGRLQVAWRDPFAWQPWEEFEHIIGRPVDRVLCPKPVIESELRNSYGLGADTVERLLAGRQEGSVQVLTETTTDLGEEEAANEPTVVNLVNKVLTEAIRAGATDIHFEPYEGKYRVRYRVDGMLEDVAIPVSVHLLKLALVSRIKIMSNLDITEKRQAQDGRCQVALAGHVYDLRISILPGLHGEAVVIRLQKRQSLTLDLEALGFEAEERLKLDQLMQRPNGLNLVTGPTGSGKTTSLYTCLSKINHPQTKIITIEDPVEYWLDNILQMQVQEEIGHTFSRALRGMLRHDPDILLVGEIRDLETADIAIRSALTGHLVLATLHTSDAASAVTRLLDIGIEPFLLSSSVNGIVAQRLIRVLCRECRRPVNTGELSDFERSLLSSGKTSLWRSQGCSRCRFSGFSGRTVIAEVLLVDGAIKQLIQERLPAERIKAHARQAGMRTLRESAIERFLLGDTDSSEVLRVTHKDD